MAELRKISYLNGNVFTAGVTGNTHCDSDTRGQLQEGYKKFSYELQSVQTDKNGSAEKGRQREMPAVVVRNASKYYKKGVPVLQNLNMTVQRGAIYSLLGSSGCGKTTLTSCLVGVRKLNAGEGEVHIFGYKAAVVERKMIGYMPQEISLYNDFSIFETLSYFGTLYGMSSESVKSGTTFLTKLLSLPEISRRVGTLSGGQQRRVSFAVALIHDPELLILDEPTVGVDPLLREHIWNHLVHLSEERGRTIIITTHYYDEAKKSTVVGIMRHGSLIVEQDPKRLLENFNTTTLETVVLEMCKKDGIDNDKVGGCVGDNDKTKIKYDVESPDDTKFIPPFDDEPKNDQVLNSVNRIKSLVQKNVVVLLRNLMLFFFSVIMPAIMTFLMCVTFKEDAKHLNFGVVNYEMLNLTECINLPPYPPGECDIENLSCQYINHFSSYGAVDLVGFETEEQAITGVHEGSVWGYMVFPQDYSSFTYERSTSGANIDDEVFNKSEIVVKMDQTNKNIVSKLKKGLYDSFEVYAKSILSNCGFDDRQAEFALKYHQPVFGTDDMKFIDFVAPSFTIGCMFFFPIIAASIRCINDKKQGTHERSIVAGTKTWEILVAYGCTELFVLIAQSSLIYIVLNAITGIEILGSVSLVMLLYLLSGFSGVSMGFCIGSFCNEEVEAALLAMAVYLPNMVLSGIFWPIEGMPEVLQYVAYILPCTLTGESMRSLFSRGWPFSHPKVWPGFVSISGYTLLYFLLTILIQKFKNQ